MSLENTVCTLLLNCESDLEEGSNGKYILLSRVYEHVSAIEDEI